MKSPARSLLLLAALLAGCSPDPSPGADSQGQGGAAPPPGKSPARPSFPQQLPHSSDPRVAACADALEAGDLSKVQELLLSLGEEGGSDTVCLRARLLASQGDAVGAVRDLEAAHKRWPNQGAIFATAAEIHAAGGRLETAREEIRAGLAAAGPTPDLSRARGVLLLLQQGGAEAGLAHLLEARQADPGLLFCRGPQAEAHRLLATQALAKPDPRRALVHAREGLAQEPDHPELKLLLADALVAVGDYDAGLPAYEELARGGRDLGASLRLTYQKGATSALAEGRKDVAFERYLRARQLGASNEELGFGAHVLRAAAEAAQLAADQAHEREDFAAAREELNKVLRILPRSVGARNQLGVVCFRAGDFSAASEAWRAVLDLAAADQVELPEPVHLNLGRALYAQGKLPEVREVLEAYLAKEPTGTWAEDTRAMLAKLDG
ncbi:MAG: hypothetical protein IPK67_20015 [Planctomycetes bacterium]|nr:hypothetical protein [Planctomycetota bacterium]